MSKQEMRRRLAALSFSEKVKILEKLRDRSLAFSIVSVFLVPGPNDPTSNEERQKLEGETQRYLSLHLKGGSPNSSRSVLNALLTAWLAGRGRKVRFELTVDGPVRGKEVSTVEELNNLIGQGRTPTALLQALGAASSL